VFGNTESANIAHAGVSGEAFAGARGVFGRSISEAVRGVGGSFGIVGTGLATGVDGRGDGAGSFGVVGKGTATGVDGAGVGAGSFGVVGVGGVAGVWGGNSTSGGIGVVGVSGPFSGGATPWAGRFDGGVLVSGNLFVSGGLFVTGTPKSSVVPHPDGSQRVMHAVETPESWFEDVGRAYLRQGVARVEVDPDFVAVSGLGEDYHVFVTPEGPSNGLYVADRTSSGFEVREQSEGASEISFSYRIMTKRSDVRTGRLELLTLPSEAGQVASAEPAKPPASPSPSAPKEPEAVPAAKPRQEAAASEPPTDWPLGVSWPPDVIAGRDEG
jgi:hypothetical protein